ncbi:hypothetical protein H2201_004047 [Coniosporium apollinis]|uniref:Uncharacterized protein n=1 Tax=Coniosporium apollinis TaxID=61459 RepID=A0ABQ9NVF0_9PEZI|nr:hypothetical protein H2201_004047 [Coniosporium apollinis]
MARAAARADARELDNSDMDSIFGPAHSGVVRLRPNRKAKAAWKPLDLSDIDSDNYYTKPEGLAKTNDFPRRIEQILGDETNITALTSDSVSSRRDSVASLVPPISHHSQYEFTPQARNRTPSKAFNQTARADLANPAHTSTPSEPAQNRSNDSPVKPYPDDIITVFGPNLPKPGFLDQTEGEREGEVRFVHHPNDDVSAHQWSSTEFRWVNLGQFSYERKRTEGTLAKDRLRGQTAEMSLQQHSLAYFRAVSKQREGSDLREGTPQLPSFTGIDYNKKNRPPLHTTILGDTTGRYASLSTVNPTQEMNLPTLGNLGLSRGPAAANQQPPHFPQPFTNLQDDPFVSSPPAHLPNNPGPYPAINDHTQPRPVQGMNFGFQFPSQPEAGGQPDMESNSIFEASDRRRQMFAEQERNRIQQNLWPENRQKNLRGIDVGEEAANSLRTLRGSAPEFAFSTETQPAEQAPLQQVGNLRSTRASIKEQVSRLSDSAAARTTGGSLPRTVLHDPQAGPSTQTYYSPAEPLPRPAGSAFPPHTLPSVLTNAATHQANQAYHIPPQHYGFLQPPPQEQPPTSSGSAAIGRDPAQARQALQHNSDPIGNYQNGEHDIITFTSPSNLTWDQLKALKPTPQNFKGPFFQDTIPTASDLTQPLATHKDFDTELHDWWTNAKLKERHKEAYEAYTQVSSRLSTRSIRGRAQGQGHPGAIGSGRPSQLNPDTSPGITRLLIPIFENLSSYVQGPEETRHDYWAPYVKPKAEWVDENPEKARSFFGKTEASPVLERARRESVFKAGGTGGAPQTLFERLGGRGLEGLGGVRGGAGIGFGSFAAGVW